MKNPGKAVTWFNANKEAKQGIAFDNKQIPGLLDHKKAFITCTNDEYEPLLDDKGKHITAIVDIHRLTITGFID
jgi:hypothetical protein